jgi:hypothetical protein
VARYRSIASPQSIRSQPVALRNIPARAWRARMVKKVKSEGVTTISKASCAETRSVKALPGVVHSSLYGRRFIGCEDVIDRNDSCQMIDPCGLKREGGQFQIANRRSDVDRPSMHTWGNFLSRVLPRAHRCKEVGDPVGSAILFHRFMARPLPACRTRRPG